MFYVGKDMVVLVVATCDYEQMVHKFMLDVRGIHLLHVCPVRLSKPVCPVSGIRLLAIFKLLSIWCVLYLLFNLQVCI